ncbi:MAG: cell wall hydrolase [Lachnospiraceae bacterium]|nr:cell wall hydrolase [Lachnospiraceae bacterium]
MSNINVNKIKEISILSFIVVLELILAIAAVVNRQSEKAEEESTEIETTTELATSQEIEEETTISADRTGEISFGQAGLAKYMDRLSEANITICEWESIVLSQDELELLYTTVYCESGNQGYEAQVLTALAILNRLASENYAEDLRGVIYQRNSYGTPQFSVIDWPDFENRGWSESVEEAVNYALQVNEHPRDMYYFRASYYHSFGEPYTYIADTYFSTKEVK